VELLLRYGGKELVSIADHYGRSAYAIARWDTPTDIVYAKRMRPRHKLHDDKMLKLTSSIQDEEVPVVDFKSRWSRWMRERDLSLEYLYDHKK